MPSTEAFTIRIPTAMRDEIDASARKRGISSAAMFREILANYFNETKIVTLVNRCVSESEARIIQHIDSLVIEEDV